MKKGRQTAGLSCIFNEMLEGRRVMFGEYLTLGMAKGLQEKWAILITSTF